MVYTFRFPLCIQLPIPIGRDLAGLDEIFDALARIGFSGVELNVTDYTDPAALFALTQKHALRISRIATGAWAVQNGLSLSTQDDAVRETTIQLLAQHVFPFAQAVEADVILGIVKGDARENPKGEALLADSLLRLARAEAFRPGSVALEATNHYETTLAHRVDQAAALCSENYAILPDTYHMNIEETSMTAPLIRFAGKYRNVHFSDNNRYFPGFGRIDFLEILHVLTALGYKGDITFEGRLMGDLISDAAKSAHFLADLCARL